MTGPLKVRIPSKQGVPSPGSALLTPTTHPKGGEAWTGVIKDIPCGVLRRWEQDEVSMAISPTRGTFTKIRKTYWSTYREGQTNGKMWSSRGAALSRLWKLHAP